MITIDLNQLIMDLGEEHLISSLLSVLSIYHMPHSIMLRDISFGDSCCHAFPIYLLFRAFLVISKEQLVSNTYIGSDWSIDAP